MARSLPARALCEIPGPRPRGLGIFGAGAYVALRAWLPARAAYRTLVFVLSPASLSCRGPRGLLFLTP